MSIVLANVNCLDDKNVDHDGIMIVTVLNNIIIAMTVISTIGVIVSK